MEEETTMHVVFQGYQTTEQAAESLLSILKMFKDRYGITHFREMRLNMTLQDNQGEDVELVDAATSEVLGVFEVYKSGEAPLPKFAANQPRHPELRLVVDNTKYGPKP
jgi:hypothetical protein